MLKEKLERVCTFFAIDYMPKVEFFGNIPNAAGAMQEHLKVDTWGPLASGGFLFKMHKDSSISILDVQRLYFQSIGAKEWSKNLTSHGICFTQVLDKLGVGKIRRIGFKTWCFMNLGMKHHEMASLMPGSFFASEDKLSPIIGKIDDGLMQIHGKVDNMNAVVIVAPMTTDQVSLQVAAINNAKHFLSSELFDDTLIRFRDSVNSECFFIDIDLFRTDVHPSDIVLFMRDSLEHADAISKRCIRQLRGIQSRAGK